MKATEQYFPVKLLLLYKVVLTFDSVVEILKCDNSNESYWAVLSCGTVYAVQGGSKPALNLLMKFYHMLRCLIYRDRLHRGANKG